MVTRHVAALCGTPTKRNVPQQALHDALNELMVLEHAQQARAYLAAVQPNGQATLSGSCDPQRVEGAALRLLQQKVLLPARPPLLGHMDRKLDDEQFAAHIRECEQDHIKPYAWVGPHNHKADSWVFMRMPSTSPAPPSSPASGTKPLIIYISSKQRAGKQPDYVSKRSILIEAEKDVWSCDAPHVYVYVTDQRLAADVRDITDERIVVVGPLQHEAFYGSAGHWWS